MAMMDQAPSGTKIPPWVVKAIALFWLGWVAVYIGTGMVRALRSFILVVLISLFISFAIEPAVNRLERWGIRRGLGTGLVFLSVIAFIAGFSVAVGAALSTQITDFVDQVPGYLDDIDAWIFRNFNTHVDFDQIRNEFVTGGGIQGYAGTFANNIVGLGTFVLGILFQAFTVMLFVFYMVAEGPKFRRTICSFLEPERQETVLAIWDLAIEKTGGYIYSRSILAILSALSHWIVFSIIGVPFPLPLALWVGVVSQFIPVIGTYFAGALPVLIAVIDKPSEGLWALVMIIIYQQIENYFFAPKITARTMEIHVAVAFAAVLIGSALLGVVGALLALPFTATAQGFVSGYRSHHEIEEETLAESARRRGRQRNKHLPDDHRTP